MKIKLWTAAKIDKQQVKWATSLHTALQTLLPEAFIQTEDVLSRLASPLGQVAIENGYSFIRSWLPQCSDFSASSPSALAAQTFIKALDQEKLHQISINEKPDLVVAFHPLAILPWLIYKDRYANEREKKFPLLALVIPEYEIFDEWVHPGMNAYLVADESLAESLIKRGIPAEKVYATGLPLHQDFSNPPEKEQLIETFQLKKKPIVLLRAVELPTEELASILFQLSLTEVENQYLIDFGEEEDLAKELRKIASNVDLHARMFGGQKHLQSFLTISDLVLCSPSTQTIAQALSCNTPLLLWKSNSEREEQQARRLGSLDLASLIQSPQQLSLQLDMLCSSPHTQLQRQRNESQKIQLPESSTRCAQVLKTMLNDPEMIQKRDLKQLETERKHLGHQPSVALESSFNNPLEKANQLLEKIEKTIDKETSNTKRTLKYSDSESWKQIYTDVLLREKKSQRAFEELDEGINQWEDRLELAEKHNQSQLIRESQIKIDQLLESRKRTQKEWQKIQDEKQKLKEQRDRLQSEHVLPKGSPVSLKQATVSSQPQEEKNQKLGSQAPTEKAFKKLNMEEELLRLKKKMRLDKSQIDLSSLKDEKG